MPMSNDDDGWRKGQAGQKKSTRGLSAFVGAYAQKG